MTAAHRDRAGGRARLWAACLLLAPLPALAWSPQTAAEIAWQGARIAPPDLKRQIERHKAVFREGVLEPVQTAR